MSKYKTSTGESLENSVIDRRISKAKEEFLEDFRDQHGFYFCERTKRSDVHLECSHIISVRICKASGRSELAYSKKNLELLGRFAHEHIESQSNQIREDWFKARQEGLTFEEFKLFNNL